MKNSATSEEGFDPFQEQRIMDEARAHIAASRQF
jgi:hypothetical protein